MLRDLLRGRPAVFTGIALAIGITSATQLANLDLQRAIITAAALLAATIALVALRRARAMQAVLLFLSIALFGFLLARFDTLSYTNTWLARISTFKPKAILVGEIADARDTKSDYLWTFRTDSVGLAGNAAIASQNNVLLRVPKEGVDIVPNVGSKLRVFTTLEPFRGPTNPFEYASELVLQRQTRAEVQGYVRSSYDYYVVGKPKTNLLRELSSRIDNIHAWIAAQLSAAISNVEARGFVEAVVLGDRTDMSKETRDDFTTAGVAHILAVSGFNVAIVALVVAQLLRMFGVYWLRARTLITMTAILLYAAIVGFQPSVVRALLMIELYLAATLLERKTDALNVIFGAAIINLLVRPSDLFDVGFQLSYSAVLGLILIAPRLKALVPVGGEHRNLSKMLDAAALSLGASIASYPVIGAHFYRVSFIGFFANLPIIPLSSVITALGFLLIPLEAVSHWLGSVYGEGVTYLTKALLLLTKFSAHAPSAAHAAAAPTVASILLFCISVIFVLRATNNLRNSDDASFARLRFTGRLAVVALTYFLLLQAGVPLTDSVLERNGNDLQVLFFDVGQGDCILLRSPSGKLFFVDFGTISHNVARAERAVLPFLRAENENTIEAGFISHMHRDHFGGLPTLLRISAVHHIYTSGERVHEAVAAELDAEVKKNNIACSVLSRGDTLQLDSDLTLYVLQPDRRLLNGLLTAYGQHINTGSLAFKVVYRNTSFLFLGDIERSEEEDLVQTYGDFLHSNVVKVAHHGSLTSSSNEFIGRVSPAYAVISVGEHNLFGHPAPAVVKRWSSDGAQVYRTDEQGAVLLVSDGNSVRPENWREYQ